MLEEFALIVLGACFFFGAFQISVHYVQRFGGSCLTRSTSLKVSVRIVSCVQALLATTVGVQTVLTCPDVLYDRNVWLEKYVYFGFPYLIYDLHAMYVAYVAEHGNSLQVFMQYKGSVVIHHAALASLGFPLIIVWRRGLGDFFVGCILCSEMSTVFLSINMIVKQLQMRDTVWYTISGLMLMLSFFFCRILVFPFMYWMYGRYTGQLRLWEVPGAIPWFCTSGCVLVFLFQAYWFRIIFVQTVTGLYKKIMPSRTRSVTVGDSG